MKRILLTGGGTGGHIYPLVAVAQQLKEIAANQSIEVLLRYFGPVDIYSAYITKEGIPISRIANAKLRRYFSLLNIIDGPKFMWALAQALVKVALFWPHIAFSKGGPGALPVLFACHLYHIPIIIHESDSVPGITNQISARWAHTIELGWEKTQEFFPNKNIKAVGIPLRTDLLLNRSIKKHDAKIDMYCNPHEPIVLVLGGSQGSQRINDFILQNLESLLLHCQVIHQIGSGNFEQYMQSIGPIVKVLPEEQQKKYHPYAYLENTMATAYAAADCIISRSGSVIFEIAAFGKPSILIPFPEAANDHQRINAYAYAKTGAAIVIEENNCGGARVIATVQKILTDHETNDTMSQAAHAFAKLDAAKNIAHDILSVN